VHICRFLVRLLLVHGTLSNYRLARLIKYSFFKNILFCAMLFLFQVRHATRSICYPPRACTFQCSAFA
jgi:magnesium-transporting ATPase (P-type)